MIGQEVLFKYFVQYNTSTFPMQIVAYVLCLVILFAALSKFQYSNRVIAAVFAFFWIWVGIVFWIPGGTFFPLVYAFAALCVIQGALFAVGVAKPMVSYRIGTDVYSFAGIVLIVYALIGYPLVGYAVGHAWPLTMLVGSFPCPTTVFTLGLFLCTESRLPKYLLIVPLLTAAYAMIGAFRGTVPEDVGLVVAGILALAMLVYRDRKVTIGHMPRPA